MVVCTHVEGPSALVNRARGIAFRPDCNSYGCPVAGKRKAGRVEERVKRHGVAVGWHFMLTFSLPRSAWPTPRSFEQLQAGWSAFLRYCVRHHFIEDFAWVREVGEFNAACVCLRPSEAAENDTGDWLDGCICGANGSQLHRHVLIRAGGYHCFQGHPFLRPHARKRPARGRSQYAELRPLVYETGYAELQAAARRCGLGTLDLRPVVDADGAARYVSKYLTKSLTDGSDASIERYSDFRPRRCGFSQHVPPLPVSEGWFHVAKSPARVLLEETGELLDGDPSFVRWPTALSPPLAS